MNYRRHGTPIINVLFTGTRNAAGALMAEALLNFVGLGRFWAYSAGSQPVRKVDALAIETLRRAQIPCGGLWPKKVSRFTAVNAPWMNLVISIGSTGSLADSAHSFPGCPPAVSSAIEDPSLQQGSHEDRCAAYHRALRQVEDRIIGLISLPQSTLPWGELQEPTNPASLSPRIANSPRSLWAA